MFRMCTRNTTIADGSDGIDEEVFLSFYFILFHFFFNVFIFLFFLGVGYMQPFL